MKIEVVGPGCQKCQLTAQHVEEALNQAGVKAEVVKVENVFDFGPKGVNRTPAVIIDGQVKLQGRVATVEEIIRWVRGGA